MKDRERERKKHKMIERERENKKDAYNKIERKYETSI